MLVVSSSLPLLDDHVLQFSCATCCRYWLIVLGRSAACQHTAVLPFSLAQAEAPRLLCIDSAMLFPHCPPVPHALQLCLDALFAADSAVSLTTVQQPW